MLTHSNQQALSLLVDFTSYKKQTVEKQSIDRLFSSNTIASGIVHTSGSSSTSNKGNNIVVVVAVLAVIEASVGSEEVIVSK